MPRTQIARSGADLLGAPRRPAMFLEHLHRSADSRYPSGAGPEVLRVESGAQPTYSSLWFTMLITLPSGARTKNLRTPHGSWVSG